jgi:hypothetical protein
LIVVVDKVHDRRGVSSRSAQACARSAAISSLTSRD